MFREKLMGKGIKIDQKKFKSVYDDLSNNRYFILMLEKLRKSLERLG